MPTRREFLPSLAAGAAAFAAMPSSLPALGRAPALPSDLALPLQQGAWDTNWGSRLNGKVRACFDTPEVESGFPVWRASIWAGQYEQVLNVPARDTSTALVLRHNAIIMAMTQAYWDKYGIGKAHKVMHPLTGEPTDKNPALMGAAEGVGAPFNDFALDKFLARGGVALACNLALQFDVVPTIQKADNVSAEEANTRARAMLVPGVILQPSGMFAVMRAQQAGCYYFRAS